MDGCRQTRTPGRAGRQVIGVREEATGGQVGLRETRAEGRGGPAGRRRGGVGFQKCHGLKGAEKGAGPGSAGPAFHAEPLTSLPAGDPAPFPASEAPPRAPAPGPSTQDPNKTRAPWCRDPALPGNKKSFAYWPRVQLATSPVKLPAIGRDAGVPSHARGSLSQCRLGVRPIGGRRGSTCAFSDDC